MTKRYSFFLLIVLLCLSVSVFRPDQSYAKDKKLTPEEVVAKHLESLGAPEALAAVKSRAVYGLAAVKRPIGIVPETLPEPGKRTDPSNFLLASEGHTLAMTMKFYDPEYPKEHFAFDGKDATVSITASNRRSLIGEFFDTYSGMLREGILGGVLSTSWPLLNIQEGKFKLQYDKKDIDGVKYHQLTYNPKSRRYLDNIVIHMFFELESYRHIMTEYILMGPINPVSFVFEKFGNFKNVDGLMLPHSYSLEYNVWKGARPTLWMAEAKQIFHNQPIDPQLLRAR
jgi:hypothetical protein